MKTLFDPAVREEMLRRIRRVEPDSRARWGRMTSERMIVHLIDGLKIAFAEIETDFRPGFLSTNMGRWLVISAPIPWPRGRIQAASVFFATPPSGSLERDKELLIEFVERFGRGREQRWGISPLMGRLSADQWAALNRKHLDHHLTQFGC
jgi:hypothetical protein